MVSKCTNWLSMQQVVAERYLYPSPFSSKELYCSVLSSQANLCYLKHVSPLGSGKLSKHRQQNFQEKKKRGVLGLRIHTPLTPFYFCLKCAHANSMKPFPLFGFSSCYSFINTSQFRLTDEEAIISITCRLFLFFSITSIF